MAGKYSKKQFEFAVKDMPIEPRSVEIAYKELVEGQKRADIGRDYGVSRQWLKFLVDRIELNLKKRLYEEQLIMITSIVTPENAKKIREMEGSALKKKT